MTGTPVMGAAAVDAAHLAAWAAARSGGPKVSDWTTLATLYIEEGAIEGVAGDLAFCQAIHETGWFQFGGDVEATQNNFAGLGATGGGVAGASFPDPQTGIRAQIQHLKAYGSAEPLRSPPVDPRLARVPRGSCPTWESLDGHWAVPGVGYGETIVALRADAANFQEAPMNVCPFAEWRGPLPTTNYAPGPSRKIGVVHHVIVGTLASADGEFHRQGAQLSAHFGVGDGTDEFPDGHLVQWLDIADDAYAQAAGNYPPTAYIAIETAGEVTTPWTSAQMATLARLDAWCAAQCAFPLALVDHGQPGLTTHCHYPSGAADPAWGNHSCPGPIRLGQMPALLALIQGGGATQGDDDMPKAFVCEDPATGGTWAVLTDDGEVDTADGAPYLGGLNNHPEFHALDAAHPIVGVAPWKDAQGAWGYKIAEFDPTPPTGQGRVRYYRFPRNGQYVA
jgi:hypothetical protein